jgi:hypothetical protein
MFTWLNKQGVQSDRGFVLQRTGRFTAEYREHGKVVTLDVEAGLSGGLQCLILDPDAFGRWDGEAAKIPANQQQQMFQNVKEALEFQGLKMVVEKAIGSGGR